MLIILNTLTYYFLLFLMVLFPLVFVFALVGSGLQQLIIDEAVAETSFNFFRSISPLVSVTLIMVVCYVGVLISFYITYQFRTLFKSLKTKNIFTDKNTQTLNKIAYASIALALYSFASMSLFIALVLLLFAKIFAYGVMLEEDKNLTI